MSDYNYGQKEPMENEAMVRTLDAQARAIWPQEKIFFASLLSHSQPAVIDVGCGTGEMSSRIVKEFSPRRLVGIDIADTHIERAQRRHGTLPGIEFRVGDAASLEFNDNEFDVAICRHMLHALPQPERVIKQMIRVVKPGGSVYFLAEDYGMLFFHPTNHDIDEFFGGFGGKAAAKAGSDLRQGRKMPSILLSLKCADIKVNYLCIDTQRVGRELMAEIFTHWRDGFEAWISQHSGRPLAEVRAYFNDMIQCSLNPTGYAAWLIPSVSARVTEESKKS